jgi:isopenicillin N synthase-like dioxygenase
MDVKVCNLRSNDFESQLLDSIINTGFVVLTHHGIDHGLIKECQMAWKLFFLNNPEYKNSFANLADPNMGYKGMKQEKAVGAKVADLKEFFHWRPGQKMPHEVWALTQQIFYQLDDVGMQILHVLDKEAARKRGFYQESCWNSDNTILRSLYYPAMDFSKEPEAVRAAAHEDINFITLLVAASAPGLQVLDKKGNWHNVPHEENSVVVNIGDMLQLASGGHYKSTTHRVINPDNSSSDRVSMPLFIHPHSNTLLAEGITAKQYLDQRLAEIYQANK